jgi:hypothetical protein
MYIARCLITILMNNYEFSVGGRRSNETGGREGDGMPDPDDDATVYEQKAFCVVSSEAGSRLSMKGDAAVHEHKALSEHGLRVCCPRFVRTRARTTDQRKADCSCHKALRGRELCWSLLVGWIVLVQHRSRTKPADEGGAGENVRASQTDNPWVLEHG